MRERSVLLVLSLILLAVAGALPAGQQQIEIAHKGCFHSDEVSPQADGDWDGLYQQGQGFQLVTRGVRVGQCRDPMDDPGKATGREVIVDGDEMPLFLVRGLTHAGSKPVSILTTYPVTPGHDLRKYLAPGEQLPLMLGRMEYRLAGRGKYDPTRPPGDRLVLEYRLTLSGPGGRSQVLPAPARFAEDGVPSLVWAGDLDRDGKLDLYMDMTDSYNVTEYVLFLSSRAAPGQLVKAVASRRYVGC